MTDEQTLAPEASDEVVPTEVEQTEAPEAVDSTEGQDDSQPAEDETPEDAKAKADAEAEEQKSRSAERRERRKAKEAELRESESAARKAAEDAEARYEALKEAAQSLPKPKQSDFPDFDEYQAALSAFNVTQVYDSREMRKLETEAKSYYAQVDQVKVQKQQEDAQNWAAQAAEARTRYADFDAVAFSDQVTITQDMAGLIVQSDVAADVSYYLGKNPKIASDISTLDPISMARAIGRLEAQVTAPKPKTTTDTPPPVNPVKGKATATKDPGDMNPAEYRKWREGGGTF